MKSSRVITERGFGAGGDKISGSRSGLGGLLKQGQEKSGVPQSSMIVWKVSFNNLNDSARTRYPKHAWEP